MIKRLFLILISLFSLSVAAENNPYRDDVLWVVTPNHPDWLYAVNESASLEVRVFRYGMPVRDLALEYEIGPDMREPEVQGRSVLQDGVATIDVGTRVDPGFNTIRLSADIDGQTYEHHIKLGFEPEKLAPVTQRPADFDAFWQAEVSHARRVPMVVEKTFVPEFSSALVNCYLIRLQAYEEGNYIYGYLTVPNRPGKFPAVFSPPGAGIKPMTPEKDLFYAESGMIRFDMEIHGIRPDLERSRYEEISRAFGKGNTSYLVNGLDDRDNYYMKKAYLSSLRVLDFLTSLSEWDGKNLIAQGTSQGGALALVAAALDERITAVAANHPALVDMAGYKKPGRAGGYPHLFTRYSGMDTEPKLATLAYYDVVNFIPSIAVPVLMSWGYNDETCPPTTSYVAFNAIQSEKQALITPATEHWISTTTRRAIFTWVQAGLQ